MEMMTYRYVIIFLIPFYTMAWNASAQNLVPNPSFEDTSYCPCITSDCFDILENWTPFRLTPDYYNACNPPAPFNGVPSNWSGYQPPASGSGYCGFYAYSDSNSFTNARECIGAQLTSALNIGQKYFASLKVSFGLGDTSSFRACAANKLGILLTTQPYDASTNPVPINNLSHIRTDSVISDSTNWVLIFGSFIADSNYQYVVLGNFYVDDSTSFIPNDSACLSYYYVDDVCVSTDSIVCHDFISTSKEIRGLNGKINLFPNPANYMLNLEIKEDNPSLKHITVVDSQGKMVVSLETSKSTIQIPIALWTDGIYLVNVFTMDSIFNHKLVISKTP